MKQVVKYFIMAIVCMLLIIACVGIVSLSFKMITLKYNMFETIELFAKSGDCKTMELMAINAGNQFAVLTVIIILVICVINDQINRRSK